MLGIAWQLFTQEQGKSRWKCSTFLFSVSKGQISPRDCLHPRLTLLRLEFRVRKMPLQDFVWCTQTFTAYLELHFTPEVCFEWAEVPFLTWKCGPYFVCKCTLVCTTKTMNANGLYSDWPVLVCHYVSLVWSAYTRAVWTRAKLNKCLRSTRSWPQSRRWKTSKAQQISFFFMH